MGVAEKLRSLKQHEQFFKEKTVLLRTSSCWLCTEGERSRRTDRYFLIRDVCYVCKLVSHEPSVLAAGDL